MSNLPWAYSDPIDGAGQDDEDRVTNNGWTDDKPQSWNYETIKAMAKDERVPVSDLVALSPKNDPFYVGTPGDQATGQWFSDLWQRFGYGTGVHVRRVHYQIVSQSPPVLLPDGTPYENTERCWDWLTFAAKTARYLGLVDPAAFVDRRNPEPISYVPSEGNQPWLYTSSRLWSLPELPAFPSLPGYDLYNYMGEQRYHLEIYAEKSTMNDVLLPLCQRFGAVLQTGLGELSITAALAAVERIAARDKPARIFYVSDFDPAGQSMPVAMARKLEYFIRSHGLDDADVRVFPVVLTAMQVALYRLPRTPIKATETRAAGFEARFGTGAVELDALEALHPGELDRVLSNYLDRYYDHDLERRVESARRTLESDLHTVERQVYAQHESTIAELTQQYEALRQRIAEELESQNRSISSLWAVMEAELANERPDVEDYPVPEADEAVELPDPLYDSSRDYREQLDSYKAFQQQTS